tara:strand:+ start:137 stop:439 length:303 start_codon:yes stop_codon:yes gene_type:complete
MSELLEHSAEQELPSSLTMNHAAKLSVKEDKPIMLDYWCDSCIQKVFFGVRSNEEKLLVRSADEYTSPIAKIFKVDKEYIVLTENSIYLVSATCQSKKIT